MQISHYSSNPASVYQPRPPAEGAGWQAKDLYFSFSSQMGEQTLAASQQYLEQQLELAASLEADFPSVARELPNWVEANTAAVGQQYQEYLARRKAGAARQYFSNKSHALNFLRSVAPTKLVDGCWLYGLVRHWEDARFAALIRIYLEELGEGMPDKNHVLIYRRLLAAYGCEQWQDLAEEYFVQGAIQLSLAYNVDRFLPEIIGFNLGYEQLPLHLLITAYELNELGIDPYYFTLHITVDNVSTGHAKKAVEGLLDAFPLLADRQDFYRRVVNGYKLNLLGASTNSVIAAFDLEDELIHMLGAKAEVGRLAHSDFCRIEGRSINQWLASGEMTDLLQALQRKGWIKRHEDPAHSRFWALIEGEKAEMFGIFNSYEKQLIHDWIAGDAAHAQAPQLSYKAKRRLLDSVAPGTEQALNLGGDAGDGEFNVDLRLLEHKLAALNDKPQIMQCLTGLMSPLTHHTPPGLMATRIYSSMLVSR